MVKCITCPNFEKDTRYCSWHKAFISKALSTKNVPCAGHPKSKEYQRYKNEVESQKVTPPKSDCDRCTRCDSRYWCSWYKDFIPKSDRKKPFCEGYVQKRRVRRSQKTMKP